MGLAEDIRGVAGVALAALDDTHDYYTHTERAWGLIRRVVRDGRKFTFVSPHTGTRADERAILALSRGYIADNLASATFQHFVSTFEDFFFDLLRLWLAAYPGSLSKKQLEFSTVLNAPDIATVVLAVVDRELNEIKYERVADWFAYLERLAKLGVPTGEEIERLAEIKASRDILVHNKGVVNPTYLSKSGKSARFAVGQDLEVDVPYHLASWESIKKLVRDLSTAMIEKVHPPPGGAG
jgi:hypothetical protein